jgi:hypothetical protein
MLVWGTCLQRNEGISGEDEAEGNLIEKFRPTGCQRVSVGYGRWELNGDDGRLKCEKCGRISLKLLPNCPKFEKFKLLPSWVQSAVREDAFQVFLSALGGTDPSLTTENRNDRRLLCKEFGLVVPCSKISALQERASVMNEEASWWN